MGFASNLTDALSGPERIFYDQKSDDSTMQRLFSPNSHFDFIRVGGCSMRLGAKRDQSRAAPSQGLAGSHRRIRRLAVSAVPANRAYRGTGVQDLQDPGRAA